MKIHEIMEKMDARRKTGCAITPVGLLVIILILAAGAALLLPALAGARKSVKKRNCINCLKCIGVEISMHEDRYKAYPPGESTQFYENLLRGMDVPDYGEFVCPARGGKPGPGVCQYRGPAKPVTDDLEANTAIGSDYPDNHGPQEDVNVLYFDGHVDVAWYGSTGWRQADKETR